VSINLGPRKKIAFFYLAYICYIFQKIISKYLENIIRMYILTSYVLNFFHENPTFFVVYANEISKNLAKRHILAPDFIFYTGHIKN
jgi:hypothetical protein